MSRLPVLQASVMAAQVRSVVDTGIDAVGVVNVAAMGLAAHLWVGASALWPHGLSANRWPSIVGGGPPASSPGDRRSSTRHVKVADAPGKIKEPK